MAKCKIGLAPVRRRARKPAMYMVRLDWHWVKHGMEWNGMDWIGLEWNGMEFYHEFLKGTFSIYLQPPPH